MPNVNRHAKMMLCVACVLFVGSNARAATVVWTIDTTLTTMGLRGTGRAPLGTSGVATLKIIQQGAAVPIASITPLISAKIAGSIRTDWNGSLSSTITFLKTGLIDGLITGTYTPDSTGNVGTTLAGDIGTVVLAKLGALPFSAAADGVLRDMTYDISSPAIAISGGSFNTSTMSVAIFQGRLDYRGYNLGSDLGSGNTGVAELIPGDANYDRIVDGGDYTLWADHYQTAGPHGIYDGDFTANNIVDGGDYTIWADHYLQSEEDPFPASFNLGAPGKITIAGSKATMTIPLLATVVQILDEADSSTTTDDISVDLKFEGNFVFTATIPGPSQPIPEPSTMALAIVAGLSVGAAGIQRKLRRKA